MLALLALPQSLSAQEGQSCSPPLYYLYRGDYDRSIAELHRAATGSPAADENIRGVALLMKDDVTRAVAAFRRSLSLDDSFVQARFNLGVALLRLKDYPGARKELETVVSVAPDLSTRAALHLGILELHAGDHAAAGQWLDRVVGAEPDNAEAHFHLGQVRENEGDLQGAGRAYRRFLQLRPDSPAGHLRFGIAALRSGRIDTAKRYLRHTVELAPQSREAMEAQKFLVIWD